MSKISVERRQFFVGAAATLLCAPAIVRAANLMQARGIIFPIERNWYGMVPRMWLCWTLPAIIKYQDAGFSAHGTAAEMNRRRTGYANGKPWDADGVLGVIKLDKAVRRSDAIIRAERMIEPQDICL